MSPDIASAGSAYHAPTLAGPPPSDRAIAEGLSIADVIRPFWRHRLLIGGCLALAWGLAAAATLVPAREYRAEQTIAAIPSQNGASLAGGVAALLGSGQLGGVQATPVFMSRLLLLPGVLRAVAFTPAAGDSVSTIERLEGRSRAALAPEQVIKTMREHVEIELDKQTGLLAFAVVHEDSALARDMADRILAGARARFIQVLHAQAESQQVAQVARVDSAARQLRALEARMLDFVTGARGYTGYSAAAVTRQQIERDLSLAQTAYAQAVAERDQAVAQALQETPAMVVVDPMPAVLEPAPRRLGLMLLASTVLAFGAAAALLAFRGAFGQER